MFLFDGSLSVYHTSKMNAAHVERKRHQGTGPRKSKRQRVEAYAQRRWRDSEVRALRGGNNDATGSAVEVPSGTRVERGSLRGIRRGKKNRTVPERHYRACQKEERKSDGAGTQNRRKLAESTAWPLGNTSEG